MPEESPREVRVGDMTVTITRFRGLKAVLAGALVSRVMREIPELQDRVATFRKEFRQKNTITITPAMAKLPQFAPLGLTADDVIKAGGKVEFPEEADSNTILFHAFPDLFDLANAEVKKLLAIIAIPNSELEAADDADQVDQKLAEWGKRLFRQGDIDELLELVAVSLEVLQDQIMRKKDRLGKLKGLPFLPMLRSTPETPEEEQPSQTTEESTPLPASLPNLSSNSHEDSDGAEELLSTASPGTN